MSAREQCAVVQSIILTSYRREQHFIELVRVLEILSDLTTSSSTLKQRLIISQNFITFECFSLDWEVARRRSLMQIASAEGP